MVHTWYTDAQASSIEKWQKLQFGMFIHFGLYSLAGGCWNGKPVKKGYCEQIFAHGAIPPADYEALAQQFIIQNFDAEAIVSLAKQAGMRYIVLTAKHHDGFCLFDTATTDYNSVHSACRRDIVAEIAVACKAAGLGFGLYFSLIDWHCPWAAPMSSHNSDPIPPKHHSYNMQQLTELLTNYGTICELWLDMGHPTPAQSESMYMLVHSLQQDIMINGRIWNDRGDFATMPDNQLPELPYPAYTLNVPWQTPASIYQETWGYKSWQIRGDAQEKARELTESLRTVTGRGGNYLLNIGPDNTGAVLQFEAEVLRSIGKALETVPLCNPLPLCKTELQYAETQQNKTLAAPAEELGAVSGLHTTLFRYTGEDYYSLHPIVTGKRWVILNNNPAEVPQTEELQKRKCQPSESRQSMQPQPEEAQFVLGWKTVQPLKNAVKLCFEDTERSLCFSLPQGAVQGIISTAYTIPFIAGQATVQLSTIGAPLEQPELLCPDITLTFLQKKLDN